MICSYLSQKTGFDISCKLSPIRFSGKNKKNISKCCLLKILSRVLKPERYASEFLREKLCITLGGGINGLWGRDRVVYMSSVPVSVAQLDARPTGDQEVAGSTPAEVGNILSWRLIVKYFLGSFSPFRWFKKGSCQFLAKECAQYWLTAWRTKPAQ